MNEELKGTYERIADDWHRDHVQDVWWTDVVGTFLSYLPAEGTVLDAGCGPGHIAKFVAGKGFNVTGIDFSERLIAIAKEHVPEASFEVRTMESLDEMEEQFDGVFSQASLLHVRKADAAAMIARLARRVKTGGYLYVSVKEAKEGKPEEEVKVEDDYGYAYERFFSYFTRQELRGYFRDAALTIVWDEPNAVGRTVWLQIIGRK